MSRDETGSAGRVILVRHGESEGNRDRTFTQSSEVPLTPHGREQVRVTAARIAAGYAPARIVASPYTRARQTAEIIALLLALPVELDAAFREQSFGVFAGQPYETVLRDAAHHDGPRWHWRPPDGESLMDVSERVVPAFERLTRAAAGRDVVVVSHGGVMLALCAHVTGSWDGLSVTPNAGIVVVEHREGRYAPPLAIGND